MRTRSAAPGRRLFEVATAAEWNAADFSGYLDIWQALRHLAKREWHAEEVIVRVRILPGQKLHAKRKAILEYARRLKLSVKTRHKDGWILIRNVTEQRDLGKRRGRLEREFS